MGLLIAITALGMFAFGVPDGVLGVAWPSMSKSFGVSLGSLGAISVVFTSTYTATAFMSGRFLNRANIGFWLVGSAVVMGAGFLGYAFVPSWWSLLAVAGVAGAGGGSLDTGLNLFAAINLSTRVTNWIHSVFSLGGFAGAPSMTVLLVAGVAWSWGFVLVAGLFALFGMAVVSTVSHWRLPVETSDTNGGRRLTETLRLPTVKLSMFVFALYSGLEVTAAVWSFTLLTEERGLSVGTAGVWVTAYFGGLVAGRVLLGTAANIVPPDRLLGVSASMATLGAFLLWLAPVEGLGFIGVCLLGIGLGPIFPTLISTTQERVGGDHTHNAVGFQIAAAAFGGGLLPGAVGLLAIITSLEVVAITLFTGTMLLLASLRVLAQRERLKA